MVEKNTISSSVIELYIATFNRAPDSAGLTFWVNKINDDGWSIETVAASFFDQLETTEKYPGSMSIPDFIDATYQNILNRSADTPGKLYWTTALDTGAVTKDKFMLAIINGAKSWEADSILLQSKHDVGQYFAIDLELDDLSLSRRIMEDVSGTLDSRDRAKTTLDLFKDASSLNYIELDDQENTLVLDDTNDWVYAFDGNDTIQASEGVKWIHGGAGGDMLSSGSAADTIHGGAGNDTIYGNEGNDVLYGGADADSIHGNDDDDLLYGDQGDDYLYGDAGDDTLYGGDGSDVLSGGDGEDSLYGNGGNDFIDGDAGVSIIDGGAGNDILYGGSSNDIIYSGEDNDTAFGRDGDDVIDGMSGDDILYGGAGEDFLNGNDGADTLFGGSGDDILVGEHDADSLWGDTGSDILSGGAGADKFIFQAGDSDLLGYDTISDFALEDHLVLVNQGAEIINDTALDVSSAATINLAADLAAAGDGSTNAIVSWFVFNEDTYVVQDMTAGASFTDGSDLIVQLQGIIQLDGALSDILLFS